MSKKYSVEIVVDHNDGDYVTEVLKVSQDGLVKLKRDLNLWSESYLSGKQRDLQDYCRSEEGESLCDWLPSCPISWEPPHTIESVSVRPYVEAEKIWCNYDLRRKLREQQEKRGK